MRGMRVPVVMMMVALVVSTAGCARVTESFKPQPKVVTIEATVAIVGADINGGTLASGRPANLPLWPGSRLVTSSQTPGESWSADFTAADEFDAVVQGLVAGLKEAGWTAEVTDASSGAERASVLSASDSSADALFTVARSPDATLTSIDVVVVPKR